MNAFVTPRVVHVTHNGVGTPLVRSQVLPYLRHLHRWGFGVDLVTFERDTPLFPEDEFDRGAWHPVRARSGHGLAAKAIDILRGLGVVADLVRRDRHAVILARSYVPAAVALLACALVRRPWVFDMRGFLAEEYIEGGHWKTSDRRYKALRISEKVMLQRASEIVVLTRAAADRLRKEPAYAASRGKRITVIPCGADLARFRPATTPPQRPTLVYSGSVGMWYLLEEMIAVYKAARRHVPGLQFLVLNRDDHLRVHAAAQAAELTDRDVTVEAVDFARMPEALRDAHVGICLLRQGSSKLGTSAIKVAEYLASGLPVVVNAGQGDTAELVLSADSGHVMSGYEPDDVEVAGRRVAELIVDPAARRRARALAEAEYDVVEGARRYADVLRRIALRAT